MRFNQIMTLSAVLLMLYFAVNLSMGSSDDGFYKKFRQRDYKLKIEREVVTFCNRSVVEFELHMYKHNRTQFVTNTTMLFHIEAGNEIEVVVQAYKFLSNEYRIFPLRFQYNICKGLKYDIAGIQSCINSCGYYTCPFKKGVRYYICNCILDESRFPRLYQPAPLSSNWRQNIETRSLLRQKLILLYIDLYYPVRDLDELEA